MKERSRTQNSVLNILTGFGGYGLNLLLSFICRIIFVRCLNAEYLGVNGLFSNILSMLSLAELGVGTAIGYALYKPLAEHDESEIASLMQFYGKAYRIIGCTVGTVGLCLMPFLRLLIHDSLDIPENLYVLYLIYLFNSASSYFFSYRTALLTAAQKNYLVVGVNYAVVILQNIVQAIFLIATRNFIGYLLIQCIATLCYNFIISYVAKRQFPFIAGKDIRPLDKEEKKRIGSDIKALMIYKISGILVNDTDNLIITYFSGVVQVGLVSNYTLFTGILNSLIGFIFNGMTASVGNYNASQTKEKQIALFEVINLANFWLYGWAAVGIFIVASDLVKLCYGDEYILPMAVVVILAVNFYMVGMQNAVLTFKTTLGLFQYGRYILLFTAGLNLILSILLGIKWGLFGILFATAISRLLTNTWYEPYAVYKYGLGHDPKEYLVKYLQYLAVVMAAGGISFWICNLLPFGFIINLLLKIILCSGICNAIFLICFGRTKAFQNGSSMVKNVLCVFKGRFENKITKEERMDMKMGDWLLKLFRGGRIKNSWKLTFTATFIIGMLVHMYRFTNTLRSHDSLYNFYSDQNVLGSGRWFLSLACKGSSYFDLPWLIGVLSVALIALTAVVVVDTLRIDNPIMQVLTGGLLASFPAITETFYFEFTADGYMVAMFLAALAARLIPLGKIRIKRILAAATCVCLSCATYQAYVSFALVLAVCYFILEVLEDRHTFREILCWIRNQMCVYVVGLSIYLVIWKAIMKVCDYSATDYMGIAEIGTGGLHQLLLSAFYAIKSFIWFFVPSNFLAYGFTAYTFLNVLFLLAALSIGLVAIVRSKIYTRKRDFALFILAVASIPFVVCMWFFATLSVGYAVRMEQSICLLYVLTGQLYCRWGIGIFKGKCNDDKQKNHRTHFFGIAVADFAALLLLAIVLNNGVIANLFYYKMNESEEKSYAMAVELSSRIHQLDDGNIREIAIIGSVSGFDADYYTDPEGAGQLGPIQSWNRIFIYDARHIALYLSNVLDFELSYYVDHPDKIPIMEKINMEPVTETWEFRFPLCDDETTDALQESEEVQKMTCWPSLDSVKVVGDTVVVKLSETEEEE